jgi:hypothetical protein
MAVRQWETLKIVYCEHACKNVGLEAEVIYPADTVFESQPRVVAHRCSSAYECATLNQASCVWAGTNPNYDPFQEKK